MYDDLKIIFKVNYLALPIAFMCEPITKNFNNIEDNIFLINLKSIFWRLCLKLEF